MRIKWTDKSRPILPLVVYLALGLGCLTPYLSDNGDNASYIGLAEALLQGQGYTNTFYPGNPPETQYPPLLPILLIPILAGFGRSYLSMKLIPFVSGGLGLVAMFFLLRKQFGDRHAWFATLLTAINATYLLYATSILTETLYVLLSACALYAAGRLSAGNRLDIPLIILTAVLLALAFYARTVGATLIIAIGVFLLLKRQLRTCFLLGGMVGLLLAPWALRSTTVENSYYYQLTQSSAGEESGKPVSIFNRIARNIPRYAAKEFINLAGGPQVASVLPYNPLKIASSLAIAAIFGIGFLQNMRTRFSISDAYLLVYLGIFAVWPYHDARFLMPVLPFLFAHIYTGFSTLPGKRTAAMQNGVIYGSVLIFLCLGLLTSSALAYRNQTSYYTPEMAHFREACLWLRTNTPPDALILARKPRLAAAWSQRKAWWYTQGDTLPDKDDRGNPIFPTHILVTEFPIAGVDLSVGFSMLQAAHAERFHRVFQTDKPRVSLYEIAPPAVTQ